MCNCITEMRIEIKRRFNEDVIGAGCITAQLPNGRDQGNTLSSRVLIRVKYADKKFMYVPALYCPFCGEKYNTDPKEVGTARHSLDIVIRKSGEIWRIEK